MFFELLLLIEKLEKEITGLPKISIHNGALDSDQEPVLCIMAHWENGNRFRQLYSRTRLINTTPEYVAIIFKALADREYVAAQKNKGEKVHVKKTTSNN